MLKMCEIGTFCTQLELELITVCSGINFCDLADLASRETRCLEEAV